MVYDVTLPDPAALAQAGPWAVVVAIGVALGVAFVRGWIVPRFVYDREVQRGDRNEDLLGQVVQSVKDLTDEVRRRTGSA